MYELLKEEMVKALGCTEPVSLALAAAEARKILGCMPEKIIIKCSGDIVKNVQSVVIPPTHDMRGIEVAALLGCIAGKPEYGLEVLKDVKKTDLCLLEKMLEREICTVEMLKTEHDLHIICIAQAGKHTVTVEIVDSHGNIVLATKDGNNIYRKDIENKESENSSSELTLTFDDVYEFATTFKISELKYLLDMEIKCNNAIALEGLKNDYGSCIGKHILKNSRGNIKEKVKAYAAAGSDARMSGCCMPVVINSGSGNQGMLILSTVYRYAKYAKVSKDTLYRALVLANLLGIWQKLGIGKLSAFCGAVNAAAASGAAISYMRGGTKKQIGDTLINVLASAGGMFCDGAKPSCALKIAITVDSAFIASDMAIDDHSFRSGNGIVKNGVDETVAGIANIARVWMKQTDEKILQLMLK